MSTIEPNPCRGLPAERWGRVLVIALVGSVGCGLTGSFDLDGSETGTTSGESSSDVSSGDGFDATGPTSTGDLPKPEVPLDCTGGTLRLATFNLYEVGTVGSDAYDSAVAILLRIDADVVCLQEVSYWEGPALTALAADAGYTDVVQAERAPSIGGALTNACLGRQPLELVGSYTGADLSPDSSANDVGRDILVVRAHVSESCRVGVVNVHLKAGGNDDDRFRRQVELVRLGQAVSRYREDHPGEPVFAVGDFNEQPNAAALGQAFSTPPGDLPLSYRLGTDVVLPLTYDPFDTMVQEGFLVAEPMQAGTSRPYTWSDSARLDYLFWSGADLDGDEVYNACRDDETSGGLDKAGTPLACQVSTSASDHFPVFADFSLR